MSFVVIVSVYIGSSSLYNIYKRNNVCTDTFKFIIYADDTTLRTTANECNTNIELSISINKELVKVNEWLQANKLSLNVKKTKVMAFHMKQMKVQLPQLCVAETDIEYVDNFNFLGINIDKHLNWASHIKMISRKVLKTTGILNNLKYTLPKSVLKTI